MYTLEALPHLEGDAAVVGSADLLFGTGPR